MLRPKRSIYPAAEKRFGKNPLPILISFSAGWCIHCTEMKPIVRKLADELKTKVMILPVDIDDEPDLAEAAGIKAVPAFIAIDQARNLGGLLIGQQSEKELHRLIEQVVSN
ncbi:MAG: thioredoxin family protein [Candidatus Obscuribacterales bacterium]